MYNYCGGIEGKGFVYNGLIGYLCGGLFGEGVNYVKYDYSSSVILYEIILMNIMVLLFWIFFGVINIYDGYLSKYNDLSIVFFVVIFNNYR